MKIGYCTGIKLEASNVVVSRIKEVKEQGFDYLELPVSTIATCTEEQFRNLKEVIRTVGIPCEVCNLLFPGNIETTGKNMDINKIEQYVALALKRCHELGVEILVFGSGGSRRIKDGETVEKAKVDIKKVFEILDKYACQYQLQIAIEPLNSTECNFITNSLDGYALCEEANLSHINLLVDYYHMTKEKEAIDCIKKVSSRLVHMHIAEPEDRTFPSWKSLDDYKKLKEILKEINYLGRMSIEGNVSDLTLETNENKDVLRLLRSV